MLLGGIAGACRFWCCQWNLEVPDKLWCVLLASDFSSSFSQRVLNSVQERSQLIYICNLLLFQTRCVWKKITGLEEQWPWSSQSLPCACLIKVWCSRLCKVFLNYSLKWTSNDPSCTLLGKTMLLEEIRKSSFLIILFNNVIQFISNLGNRGEGRNTPPFG